MHTRQVLETYDHRYAAEYNDTFLHDVWARNSVAFQLDALRDLLAAASNWLDVACGTGYVLSQFPDVERTGLDISPAMLELARKRNANATFVEGNYRDDYPEWDGKFDVVSCMWWAYCMAESMSEVRRLIANLARWTSSNGSCFIPLCNPQKFDRDNIKIPYVDAKVPGRIMITGITWTWIQENGKRHDEVVSPQVEHVVMMCRQHFEQVQVVEGPMDQIGEGWRVQDVLIASHKRPIQPSWDTLLNFFEDDDPRASVWQIGIDGDNIARLVFPDKVKDVVRCEIEHAGTDVRWGVQLFRAHFALSAQRRYRVSFDVRADQHRTVAVGCGQAAAPWNGLGLYRELEVSPHWQQIIQEFVPTADDPDARIHFDVGAGKASVEVKDFRFEAVTQ